MKLYFLKQKSLDMLEQTIPDNLNKYQDAETWVDQYFIDNDKPNYFFDTGIEVDDYQLISGGPETDFSNAKILYEALQGHINLVQASDLRLWAYMAHKRNVTAMAHGSKLDGEIFSEFSRDWTNLSYQAQLIRAKLQNKDISEVIDLGDIDVIPAGKYRDQMMKTRVGQYFFRMTVLNSYENRCCVTGLKQPELLVASHIKPWKVSDERTERTNPANGLCLNALHDKAFDRGLITLDKRYKIIVSRKLKDTEMDSETKSWFMGYSDHQIILPDKFLPGKDFIEYHNDVIFQR